MITSNVVDRKHATLLFVPHNPVFVRLMQSLVEKIVIVNDDKETDLHNSGGDFVCVTHTRLHSGLLVVMAIDPWGQILIYAFTSSMVLAEPVARCQVLRDVDHVCAFPGPSSYSLFVSLVNIYNKVAIYLIDLAHIVQIQQK